MIRMLVTRPEPDAAETARRLAALGIEPLAAPLLERATLHTSLPEPNGFAAMAVTSTNALRALDERGVLAAWRGLPVYTVGERTAEAAQLAGFSAVRAAGGTLRHLVAELAGAGLRGPVFYPAARHQSGDLAQELAPHGIMVVTARVYDMRPASALPPEAAAALRDGEAAAVLLYSQRTAEIFVELATPLLDRLARTRIGMLCLSEHVATPLVAAHFVRIGLAEHPSEEAMMALALSFARGENTP